MKFKAVIFDMDGVLIDSELHWFRAEIDWLKQYNITLTRGYIAKMTGRSLFECVKILKEDFGLPTAVEKLASQKKKFSDAIYKHQAQAMPGVDALLKKIKNSKLKLAIASGSMLERIEMIVSRFNWKHYFDNLISTDHVNLVGKPNPAIYSYAAKRLKLKPGECVVIEDSVNGLMAAKEAGMSCIATLDKRWSYGDFSRADLIVNSLIDKKIFKFIGI